MYTNTELDGEIKLNTVQYNAIRRKFVRNLLCLILILVSFTLRQNRHIIKIQLNTIIARFLWDIPTFIQKKPPELFWEQVSVYKSMEER